jgi:hypothetical protein
MMIYQTDDGPQFEFDDPVTIKTLMVMQLLGVNGTPTGWREAKEEDLDRVLQVLIPGPDTAKRRAELIHAVYCVWVDRLAHREVKWNDVVRIFQDVQCLFGVPYKDDDEPRPRKPRRPKKSASVLRLISSTDPSRKDETNDKNNAEENDDDEQS